MRSGYTLADRTDRLQEAHELIDQALKLAPDDPFIQDSMGWVLYRLGRVDEGRAYLERAFKTPARSRNRRAPGRGALGAGSGATKRSASGRTR